jgi:para-nitrobenzyl esterase
MPPMNPAAWTGVRDAFEHGARAASSTSARAARPTSGRDAGPNRERRLSLVERVDAGLKRRRQKAMIMWCHGGGFNTGSGAAPVNDGTNLGLRGDIVTVTTNHRLNVLGYTYLGEIGGHAFEQSAALGVLDLVHALRWIHDNIERFGGDPGNVTIIGQSGGAQKVSTLLTMPSAKGLFHRAVVMSGSALQLLERDASARVTRELVAELGLAKPTIAQLQAVPIDRLMTAYFATVAKLSAQRLGNGFRPAVDGTAITQHPFHPSASRVSPDVPAFSATRAARRRSARTSVCSRSTRPACAARFERVSATESTRCCAVSQALRCSDTRRPLFLDCERPAVRRCGHEGGRAPLGAGFCACILVLLDVGVAARRRQVSRSAHDRHRVRVR